MKKLIISLLFILTFISIKGVGAIGLATPFTDYFTYSPRFQYTTDTNDDLLFLAMTFEQNYDTEDQSYKIDIQQLNSFGNVVNTLKTNYVDPADPNSTGLYSATMVYDWSDKTVVDALNNNEVVFYRIIYNDSIVLYTGGAMLRPEFIEYESNKVEFGDYIYNTGSLVRSYDQTQFTYNLESDILMSFHYRYNEDILDIGTDLSILIRDLSTMTGEFFISGEEILLLQGGTDIDYRNSFIPIFLSDQIPSFLENDVNGLSDYNSILYYDLEVGSYLVYLDRYIEGTSYDDIIIDSESSAILNIANSDSSFILEVIYDNITINKKQQIIFFKDNENSDSVYSTVESYDNALMESWNSYLNSQFLFKIGYSPLSTLDTGDYINVIWELEPTTLPFDLIESDYTISNNSLYYITDSVGTTESITTSMDWFGWNNEIGLLFVSVAILAISNIIMTFLKVEISVIIVVNGSILALLSFIGFLPVWLLIGEMIILALGVGSKLIKGGE